MGWIAIEWYIEWYKKEGMDPVDAVIRALRLVEGSRIEDRVRLKEWVFGLEILDRYALELQHSVSTNCYYIMQIDDCESMKPQGL